MQPMLRFKISNLKQTKEASKVRLPLASASSILEASFIFLRVGQHQSHLLFRFLLFLFGISFIAFTWLVYKDKEKTIQSKIENLWVKLDDVASIALKKERSIAAQLSIAVSYVIDLFLGQRLIFLQMALVSLPLSIATGFTAITLISWLQHRPAVLTELRVLRVFWMFAVPAIYFDRTSKISLILYGSGLLNIDDALILPFIVGLLVIFYSPLPFFGLPCYVHFTRSNGWHCHE